jgi:hypothetical protein
MRLCSSIGRQIKAAAVNGGSVALVCETAGTPTQSPRVQIHFRHFNICDFYYLFIPNHGRDYEVAKFVPCIYPETV